ncbi:protein of unknown function DUF162 [Methylocella silvestris BL2]|uniref:LUD domain-containing protein n=1 Tax=Methylocella silvestris (strain DSM 15510 / CIP 108128 / LMG 27833 / NCIMB 13906 / BL2) TaxID=395965 RepID=B8EKJ0_METSB|nr:LUD domain-containing protein [Methylocella silvestris]ACK51360.1 protein of unknown function DUF162 [Methylocella silvestris BL2]
MSVRDDILTAIRQSLGAPAKNPGAVSAEAEALAAESALSRPELPLADLVEAFAARLTSVKVVGASIDRIARIEDAPAAVARYCKTHGLGLAIALQPDPELAALDWSGFELHSQIGGDEAIAVAKARWAIAETGTFVFHSGPASPVLLSYLPMHHLCIIEADRILAHLEDYAIAEAGAKPPRNINFITGASGTSDIEGRLVRGAHGPAFLHGLIVDPRPSD